MISKLNQSKNRIHFKSLLRWFRIVPVIFLVLLGCGQVALHNTISTAADTQSRLIADYKTWEFDTFHPLHQAILKDIQRDKSNFPTLFNDIPEVILHPGSNWPKTFIPKKTILVTPFFEPTKKETMVSPTIPVVATLTQNPLSTPTRTTIISIPTAPPVILWPTITQPPTEEKLNPPKKSSTPKAPTATPVTPTAAPATPTFTPTATSETPTVAPATPTFTPETPTVAPATLTATPTATPELCAGIFPAGEPNLGIPNGAYASINCNGYIILDLGSTPIDTTTSDTDYDLVYYERIMTDDNIMLDHVIVEVSKSSSTACSKGSGVWTTVLYWGDSDPSNNGHLGNMFGPIESNNQSISTGDLYGTPPLQTGIAIDLDALGLSDVYHCVRITTPINWPDNDPAEVDAIQVLN